MPAHRGRAAFGSKDVNTSLRLLLLLPALLLALGFAAFFLLRGGAAAGGVLLPDAGSAPGWPRTVRQPDGSELVLPRPPERILVGNSSATDMLTALVDPERIVALPEQAFLFSVLADEPDARGFAGVPTYSVFDAETVLAFEPDLVVVDPWATLETVARLRELGMAVLSLPQVVALDDVRASLHVLGRVLGAEQRADALLADMDARVARLAASAERRAGLTAASYTNSGAGGWSAGLGTTNHELITLAGLVNATAAAGRRGHVRTSFEELYALDPDFLLVGDYRSKDEPGATASFLRTESALADLRAVREDRILVVPARLFSASSQEVVRGAEALAAAVDAWLVAHPAMAGVR
jgi:iron complex transport system substrate-binding protein